MVAAAGQWRLAHDGPSPLSLGADPNLFLSFTSLGDSSPGDSSPGDSFPKDSFPKD